METHQDARTLENPNLDMSLSICDSQNWIVLKLLEFLPALKAYILHICVGDMQLIDH